MDLLDARTQKVNSINLSYRSEISVKAASACGNGKKDTRGDANHSKIRNNIHTAVCTAGKPHSPKIGMKRFRQDCTTARTSPAMCRSRADGAAVGIRNQMERTIEAYVTAMCKTLYRILCCTRHNRIIWKVPQEPNASRVFSVNSPITPRDTKWGTKAGREMHVHRH